MRNVPLALPFSSCSASDRDMMPWNHGAKLPSSPIPDPLLDSTPWYHVTVAARDILPAAALTRSFAMTTDRPSSWTWCILPTIQGSTSGNNVCGGVAPCRRLASKSPGKGRGPKNTPNHEPKIGK